ncbi:hypothetical protein YC2023_115041 [Brassica napus]
MDQSASSPTPCPHPRGPNGNRGFGNISGAELKYGTVQPQFMRFAGQVIGELMRFSKSAPKNRTSTCRHSLTHSLFCQDSKTHELDRMSLT